MTYTEILIAFLINLISAFIGFFIGNFWNKFKNQIIVTKKRKIWASLIGNDFYIVMPRFKTTKLQIVTASFKKSIIFDSSGFLAIGDTIGSTELRKHFNTINFDKFSILYANSIKGDELKSNLILVGGPNSNVITDKILKRLDLSTTINFSYYEGQKICIKDNLNNKRYYADKKTDRENDHSDYCLIIKVSNPFATDKNVLIIGGSLGYGTWGGIRFVMSDEFSKNNIVRKKQSLECLIKVDVVRETPQSMSVLAIRPLRLNS